jgi:2-oxoglutarate ferredoxin oxidoreductase subunit beta
MANEKEGIYNYLRTDKKFPPIWCPGCGHGIVMGSMLRAVAAIGLNKDKVAVVSGIGCSGRTSTYVDFNTLHTTHGRALTFATGLKLARPDMTVLVVMGDGDALAIGGNHFIHAARRNIDLTAIIFNNYIYGMTGGQVSPTTPPGMIASTATVGNIERAFDIVKLAEAAGASFVARGTAFHTTHLDEVMEKAIRKKGFSVLDAITQCPPIYGRYNRLGAPSNMMKWQEEHAITLEEAAGLTEDELKDKFLTGVFLDEDRPEYCAEYERLVMRVQGKEEA